MFYLNKKSETTQRFTIKKYSFGAASVLIGTFFAVSPQVANAQTVVAETAQATHATSEAVDTPAAVSHDVVASDTKEVAETPVASTTETVAPPVSEESEIAASAADSDLPENFKELSEEEQLEILTELGLSEEEQLLFLEELGAVEDENASETGEQSEAPNEGNDTAQTTETVPDNHKVATEEHRVIHEPYTEVKGVKDNKFVDVTAQQLETLKTLKEATIYFEFKPTSDLSGQYALYKVASTTVKNEYFQIFYDNGVVKVEGRDKSGQFYNLASGQLMLNDDRWNNVAFTVKPALGQSGVASLYVNGEQSFTGYTPRGGSFVKDMQNVNTVQIGEDKSGYNGARSFVMKDFSVYNKAFSQDEVVKRSEHIKKEVLQSELDNTSGLSKKELVYESAYNTEAKEQGVRSFRAPNVIKTKAGTLLAFTSAHPRHHIDWGDINAVVKRSEDDGKTWSAFKTIVDLAENPESKGVVAGPFTIDTSAVQDQKTGRIFLLMDMFKQGQGVFDKTVDHRPGYTTINGMSYLNLYKTNEDQTPYTVRNGRVFTPEGKETAYTVITPELSKKANRSDIGTIFENDKEIGNIYFTEKSKSPFTTVQSSSTWLVTSDDDGKTWSVPTDITPQVKQPWTDLLLVTPNAGIQLQNGRLMIPVYTSNKDTRHYSFSAATIYSDDLGKTWHYGESIEDYVDGKGRTFSATFHNRGESTTTESTIVQLNSGKLISFARSSSGKFVMGESTDNGQTWRDDWKQWNELPSFRVQPSAVHYNQDGKEYILVSATDGTVREKGTIYLFEVKSDDTIAFLHAKQFEKSNFTYSALTHLGNGIFNVSYENTDTGYDLFSIQRRTFTFDWLMKDKSETDEVIKIVSVKKRTDGHYDIVFDHHVTPMKDMALQLSNGKSLAYVGQTALNTLVFAGNVEDLKVNVKGLVGVDSQSELPFDITEKPLKDYMALSRVVVKYETQTGQSLEKAQVLLVDAIPGELYNAAALKKPYITSGDRVYKLLGVKQGESETGQVAVDETVVTYQYTLTRNTVAPIEVTYRENPMLETGRQVIIDNGVAKETTVLGDVVVTGRPKIVLVGTKPTEVVTEIPFAETEEVNTALSKHVRRVRVNGQNGKLLTTTTYKVDEKTGALMPTVLEQTIAPVTQVVEVGTLEQSVPTNYPTVEAKPEIVIDSAVPAEFPTVEEKPAIVIASQVPKDYPTVELSELVYPKAVPTDYPTVEAKPEIVIDSAVPAEFPTVEEKPAIVIASQVPKDYPTVELSELVYPKAVPAVAPTVEEKPAIVIASQVPKDYPTVELSELVYPKAVPAVAPTVEEKPELVLVKPIATRVATAKQSISLTRTVSEQTTDVLPKTGDTQQRVTTIVGMLLTAFGVRTAAKRRKK